MITVSANQANSVAQAITGLSLDDKEIRKAFHTALGRAVLRAKNRLARDIAKELNLPLKIVRRRLLLYNRKKGEFEQKIWAGIDDISYEYLGKPRQLPDDEVIVKGLRITNAYIDSDNKVRSVFSDNVLKFEISEKAREILEKLTPYYVNEEFNKNFEQILRHKFTK